MWPRDMEWAKAFGKMVPKCLLNVGLHNLQLVKNALPAKCRETKPMKQGASGRKVNSGNNQTSTAMAAVPGRNAGRPAPETLAWVCWVTCHGPDGRARRPPQKGLERMCLGAMQARTGPGLMCVSVRWGAGRGRRGWTGLKTPGQWGISRAQQGKLCGLWMATESVGQQSRGSTWGAAPTNNQPEARGSPTNNSDVCPKPRSAPFCLSWIPKNVHVFPSASWPKERLEKESWGEKIGCSWLIFVKSSLFCQLHMPLTTK